ncbi:MAG: hypothetical protein ACFCAD_00535 [Pleurocapsa sp.]
MKEINFSTSACRYCRFYKPEGRRGGSCNMLGVPVQSSWKACTFASPPFETTLKKLEDIFQLETSVNRESNRNTSTQISNVDLDNSLQATISTQLE